MAIPNILKNKMLAIPILLAIAVAAIFFLREDLTGLFAAQGDKTIPISAELTTAFGSNVLADNLVIKFKAPSADVFVGGDKLEVLSQQDIELRLEGYKGKISFDASKLTLKGQAKKAFVNNVGRSAKRENFVVETKDLVIDSAKLTSASFNSFSSASVSGSLDLNNGKLALKLDSEPLKLGAFSGDIELASTVKLSGATNKAALKGISIDAEAGTKETPKPAETPQPTPAPEPAPAPVTETNASATNTSTTTAPATTTTSSGLTAEEIAQCGGPSTPVEECKKFLGKK